MALPHNTSYFTRLGLGLFNRTVWINTQFMCNKSTTAKQERIVVTDDGSTIVCWHPEQPFPYECSKPIPETTQETNSVLKVQSLSDIYDVFKPKSEEHTREELMKITSSTKHIWFPRGKKTYKKKPWPKNREYL